MKTQIVTVGNSQGIRIPKILLDQGGLGGPGTEVELQIQKEKIVISAAKKARQGWDEAYKAMAENKDDRLLDEEATLKQTSWDEQEWEW